MFERTRPSRVRHLLLALGLAALAIAVVAPAAGAATARTKRASVHSSGAQANNKSATWRPAISRTGRYLAFDSIAQNLIGNDTNGGFSDIYIRDFKRGKTKLVSKSSAGLQSIGHSYNPAISADGRFVAFDSLAPGLVAGDTNGMKDVFVHDRKNKRTKRVSVASDGAQGSGASRLPGISADGRFVTFESAASDLVSGDTNGKVDVFVRDRKLRKTTRVSTHSNGTQGSADSLLPVISADGRFVAFYSLASELVNGDTNNSLDVFVHDRKKGKTKRVSVRSGGAQVAGGSAGAVPALSANGRFVAFEASSSALVNGDTNVTTDIFVHDRWTRKTRRVSVRSNGAQANGLSQNAWLSASGRYVVFQSAATNLVRNDTNGALDIFVHDRRKKKTRRVSVRSNGNQANGDSRFAAISGDGRYVALASDATNLVRSDSNERRDVFRRGPLR